jgi:hypothetical protein
MKPPVQLMYANKKLEKLFAYRDCLLEGLAFADLWCGVGT